MASRTNTCIHVHIHKYTRHRRVHFNCLTVWSNSKWICDLSIDSFSPRLWIKCFNYWCTDVRCPLECCMWCRPLSPGKLLPPPRLSTQQHHHRHHPSPSRRPHAPPRWACSTCHEWNLNTLQAACRQASTNWKVFCTQIKSVLPPLPSIYCNPPHQRLVCTMPAEHCCSVEQLVSLVKRWACVENVEYWVL